jgi:glycosyltransferase involved in cell wall biosynthesis
VPTAMKPRFLLMSQSTALGGMELVNITRDIHLLRRQGWEIALALKIWPELREWTEELRQAGTQVVDYQPPLFMATWNRWRIRRIKKLLGVLGFSRWIERLKPRGIVYYSSSLTDCLAHLYYARRYPIPCALSVHQSYAARNWDRWQRRHITAALSRVCGIRCVSHDAAQGFMEAFEGMLPPGLTPTVIHNGVDLERFRPPTAAERMNARVDLGLPPEATVIGTVCRLERMKGVLPLVDTFARFHRQHPTSVLVIAGDGTQREALVATAAAAGVAESVRVLGHRRDVRLVDWALDIFTLFSKAEGFGNATLEAMSAGLPVLSTDVPGTREVVAGGETGILFPYGDWDAAVEGLTALASSSDQAMALGCKGRARAERFWSIQRRDEAMVAFLRRVFNDPAPG